MSVNSVAVLRLMGKGGGAAPVGVSRSRGSARGGRGASHISLSHSLTFARTQVSMKNM